MLLCCAVADGIKVKKSAMLVFRFSLLSLESFKYIFSLFAFGDDKTTEIEDFWGVKNRRFLNMAELKVEISDELEREIKELNLDVSSAVAKSVTEELVRFVALKTIAGKSKLTKEDAIELGRKLKEGRFKELKKKGLL